MENDGAQHRRIRVRNSGLPFEGLYDSVIDTRLQALLDVVRKAGIAVGFRELCGSDGRLVARELASVVIEAMEARLDAKKPATAADIAVVNRLLAERESSRGFGCHAGWRAHCSGEACAPTMRADSLRPQCTRECVPRLVCMSRAC